jgi:dGTPase
MRRYLFESLYNTGDAKYEEPKASLMIEELFDHFVHHIDEVPDEYRRHNEDEPEIQAADFVSGMTDRYAIRMFEDLRIPKSWKLSSSAHGA